MARKQFNSPRITIINIEASHIIASSGEESSIQYEEPEEQNITFKVTTNKTWNLW